VFVGSQTVRNSGGPRGIDEDESRRRRSAFEALRLGSRVTIGQLSMREESVAGGKITAVEHGVPGTLHLSMDLERGAAFTPNRKGWTIRTHFWGTVHEEKREVEALKGLGVVQ